MLKFSDIAALEPSEREKLAAQKDAILELLKAVVTKENGEFKRSMDTREAIATLKMIDQISEEVVLLRGAAVDTRSELQTQLQAVKRELELMTIERDRLKAVVSGMSAADTWDEEENGAVEPGVIRAMVRARLDS